MMPIQIPGGENNKRFTSQHHLLFLAPYVPELNSAEKVGWRLKSELKKRLFKNLNELQQVLRNAIKKIHTTGAVKLLCSYPYYQTINMN